MAKQRNITTLEGIEVTGWDENEERLILQAEWAKERDAMDACPKCGSKTSTLRKHSWDRKEGGKVRDTPWSGIPVLIRLKQRRYRCSNCGNTTVFQHPGVHDSRQMTEALVEKIKRDSLGPYRFYMLAHQAGSSVTPIREIFKEHVRELDRRAKPIPLALGIDGVNVPDTEGPHAVIADLWEGKVIELLETDRKPELLEYFHNLEEWAAFKPKSDEELGRMLGVGEDPSVEEIKEEYAAEMRMEMEEKPLVVVIDMTPRYRDAIKKKLPGATIVVDRYHITRRANLALGRIRIDESRKTGLTAEVKREKETLEKLPEQLRDAEKLRLDAMLGHFPRLKQAYKTRNEFLKIFEIRSRQKADDALREWEEGLPESVEEEFRKFLDGPLSEWREEILNFFSARHEYTNGSLEGLNRAIKQIRKEGAGYDFETLRAKVIYGLERRREMRERGAVGLRESLPSFLPREESASEMSIGELRSRFEERFGQSPEEFTLSDHVYRGVPFSQVEEELDLW